MSYLRIDHIDRYLKNYFEGWNLKIQLRVENSLKWVKPEISLNPKGSYSEVGFAPEIRIRSGVEIRKNRAIQPTGCVVKIENPDDSTLLDIYTKKVEMVDYFYDFEHLSNDPVVDSWLKSEFLERMGRYLDFEINYDETNTTKTRFVSFIIEGIIPNNTEDSYRTIYRYRSVINFENDSKETKVANKETRVNVSPVRIINN